MTIGLHGEQPFGAIDQGRASRNEDRTSQLPDRFGRSGIRAPATKKFARTQSPVWVVIPYARQCRGISRRRRHTTVPAA